MSKEGIVLFLMWLVGVVASPLTKLSLQGLQEMLEAIAAPGLSVFLRVEVFYLSAECCAQVSLGLVSVTRLSGYHRVAM
ncbi:hypothetical protein A9Q89_12690 [Gammaproteobacteria bacterium 53_120_T64]|nr:hypothetical protein A9Q89_12690 [Gammaproteobacteria bacterium 53_120_T64]